MFDQGEISFVVGGGGYLPCLHKLATEVEVGVPLAVTIPPADAFGPSNPDMGPVDIPASSAPPGLAVGNVVQLSTGAKCRVTAVSDEVVTIDANSPMAGKSLEVELTVMEVEPQATSLCKGTFALGCFWGGELAFQREPGVV